MRIVWLMNYPPEQVVRACGWEDKVIHGWNTTLIDYLVQLPEMELTIIFPQHHQRKVIRGTANCAESEQTLSFIGYYETPIPETHYNHQTEQLFRMELREINPELVHIWGSEYVHTLCMVNAFGCPERTVISIQGIISAIAEHYTDGLPKSVIHHMTFRDFIRRDGIEQQKEKFLKRGAFEKEALSKVGHVAGRTDWDYKALMRINPNLQYHHGREFLRDAFYAAPKWNYETCEKQTIFMSQADYPIKGMHIALSTMKAVKAVFPGIKLYLAGNNMFPITVKDRIKQSSYSKYIEKLILEYGLSTNVVFLGHLTEDEMIEQYLKANVFLQASLIENSPNSLGEAMMLGVPCVASKVGGTESILPVDETGMMYEPKSVNEAIKEIIAIFQGGEKLNMLSDRLRLHASKIYQREEGYKEYLTMYREVMNKKE